MNKNIFAFYSLSRSEKVDRVRSFLYDKPSRYIVYICPKKLLKEIKGYFKGIYFVSYEQLTQKNTWLGLNNRVDSDTVIIIENPSRYRNVSSAKVIYLQKLTRHIKYKLIIDNVPYIEDKQYLYIPYSYLNRSVLVFILPMRN